MKRILAFVFAAILCLMMFTACGSNIKIPSTWYRIDSWSGTHYTLSLEKNGRFTDNGIGSGTYQIDGKEILLMFDVSFFPDIKLIWEKDEQYGEVLNYYNGAVVADTWYASEEALIKAKE